MKIWAPTCMYSMYGMRFMACIKCFKHRYRGITHMYGIFLVWHRMVWYAMYSTQKRLEGGFGRITSMYVCYVWYGTVCMVWIKGLNASLRDASAGGTALFPLIPFHMRYVIWEWKNVSVRMWEYIPYPCANEPVAIRPRRTGGSFVRKQINWRNNFRRTHAWTLP